MKEHNAQIRNCKIADDAIIIQPINAYECEIGENTFIGPFCEIQRGVKIGKNCRIQSHTFICEGVTIEDNCFIGHGVIFINDVNPIANNPNWLLKETVIRRGASIGSNATLLPVTVGENAKIGAGAVVTKDVLKNTTVVGNPARVLKK